MAGSTSFIGVERRQCGVGVMQKENITCDPFMVTCADGHPRIAAVQLKQRATRAAGARET
jgi:hypothetical protein